jgi:hypothetical protein
LPIFKPDLENIPWDGRREIKRAGQPDCAVDNTVQLSLDFERGFMRAMMDEALQ